ncbi:hypothetical protein LTR85_008009 [Meristemomyces frigidus]|nr:hypothetical protein LTR85_008009 [Meristemomyces frigidus]
MAPRETFHFDEIAYRAQVKTMTIEELHHRECVKFRQRGSAFWSIGAGMVFAVPTCGLSLFGVAYAARRADIAHQKLHISKEEIDARQEDHYEIRRRDVIIPLAVVLATVGIGCGLEALAMDATSAVASAAVADHGLQAAKDMVHDPSGFIGGVEHSAVLQMHEMSHVASGGIHQAAATASQDSTVIMMNAGAETASQAAGQAFGATLALSAEKNAAEAVINIIPVNPKTAKVA